jgi:hypothetical protein
MWSLLLNVIGGLLAGVALIGLQVACKYFVSWRFSRFFGIDRDHPYHIIHTLYNVEPNTKFPLPESRIPGRRSGFGVNLEQVVSGATVKAVSYLVKAFAKEARFAKAIARDIILSPIISSHTDVDQSMDISFVSIGLLTNFKTLDVLDNSANRFVDLPGQSATIVQKGDGSEIARAPASRDHDYGLIVKIHPDGDMTRTWICCGGFGIAGTGGAAYFLASKWKEIRRWTGNGPFACVLVTTRGDESTRVAKIFVERLRGFRNLRRRLRRRASSFEIVELGERITG